MQRRLFVSSLVLSVGVLAGLLHGASPVSAAAAIQPGSRISSNGSACTMNFIYRDVPQRPERPAASANGRGRGPAPQSRPAEKPALYAGTAGHCVTAVGTRVANANGDFGTVAFRVLTDNDDFAFIKIDRDKEHRVNPSMLGFDGPNGVISGREARPGDTAHVYGHGLVLGQSEMTRPRSGILNGSDSNTFRATLPVIFGDSGGPVLHEDGSALGIVAHLTVWTDGSTLDGNTVERALSVAAANGLKLEVVPG